MWFTVNVWNKPWSEQKIDSKFRCVTRCFLFPVYSICSSPFILFLVFTTDYVGDPSLITIVLGLYHNYQFQSLVPWWLNVIVFRYWAIWFRRTTPLTIFTVMIRFASLWDKLCQFSSHVSLISDHACKNSATITSKPNKKLVSKLHIVENLHLLALSKKRNESWAGWR